MSDKRAQSSRFPGYSKPPIRAADFNAASGQAPAAGGSRKPHGSGARERRDLYEAPERPRRARAVRLHHDEAITSGLAGLNTSTRCGFGAASARLSAAIAAM
jgi:hypothetical protein